MKEYFFSTDLILFRKFKDDDWKKLYKEEFYSHDVRVFEPGIRGVYDEKDFIMHVEQFKNKKYQYAIENEQGEFVGTAKIAGINERHGHFEVTIRIFTDQRRKGYGKDALFLLLRFGFMELRMNKCNSETIITNTKSIALHRALGFKDEGIRRRNVYTDGEYYDEILFGMTKEEFEGIYQKEKQKS